MAIYCLRAHCGCIIPAVAICQYEQLVFEWQVEESPILLPLILNDMWFNAVTGNCDAAVAEVLFVRLPFRASCALTVKETSSHASLQNRRCSPFVRGRYIDDMHLQQYVASGSTSNDYADVDCPRTYTYERTPAVTSASVKRSLFENMPLQR